MNASCGTEENCTQKICSQFQRRLTAKQKISLQDSIPLNEAAKLEMASLPTKTPVSVLQELLARRGTVPKYELVQIEGLIHEPIFRYRVMVSDVFAHGTGRSKKQAKHKAAKALLEKLTGEASYETNSSESQLESNDPNVDSPYEVNPIGWLQEMCMKRFLTPPQYVTEHGEGTLPHERQFTVACVLMNHKEIGRGKSKKVAKRLAAYRMWQLLQEAPHEENKEDEDEISKARRELINKLGQKDGSSPTFYSDLKASKIPTISTNNHKVFHFHKSLRHMIGEKISQLQVAPLWKINLDSKIFLEEIGKEQNFDITYVDIEEKSVTDQYHCLVQLLTTPVTVVYGNGPDVASAQRAAAQKALEHLKIMTTKPQDES